MWVRFSLYNNINLKIITMYEALEHWKVYKQEEELTDNSTKLVSEYDKESFDKWMEELITKNGTTEI